MTIEVSSCRGCPFVDFHDAFGYCGCNRSGEITKEFMYGGQMPHVGVHEKCPLKEQPVTVILSGFKFNQ